MTDNKSNEDKVVERRFCTSCNREVSQHDTAREPFIVVDGDRVVEIGDRLRHKGCGGTIRPLMLLS